MLVATPSLRIPWEVASQQHLSSARSKKMVSGRRTTLHEAAPSLQNFDASCIPAQGERDASGLATAEKPSEDLLIDGIKSARVIAADGPV